MVRKYLAIADNTPETVIVRQTSQRLCRSRDTALKLGITELVAGLTSQTLLNQPQIAAHQEFSNQIETAPVL